MSGVQSYDFLFGSRGDDRVERLTVIQEHLRSMRKTSGTWTVKDLPGDLRQYSTLPPEFFHFLGSWKAPDHLVRETTRATRWVNPEWPHAWKYSDVAVECQCGGIILREWPPSRNLGERFGHRDDCPRERKERCNQELFDRRINTLVLGANYWLTGDEVAPRLGYEDRTSVMNLCKRAGLTWVELRKCGRERMIETWDQLCDRGYSYSEIGVAFDVSEHTVKNYVNRTSRGL